MENDLKDITVEPDIPRWSGAMVTFAACCTVGMIVLGVAGNLLTLVALARDRKLRSPAAVFIASLSLSDLVLSVTVLPLAVWRWTGGGERRALADPWCALVPVLRYGNVGVSLLSIALISVNRWLLVERAAWHARLCTWRASVIATCLCWVAAYSLQLPALTASWGRTGFDPALNACTILRDERGRSPKTALFVIAFVLPCAVIVASYARIYWCVRASSRRVATSTTSTSSSRREWRLTRMVLAIFVCFLLCYLPITLVKTLDDRARYPRLHVAGYLLLYASSCVNPLIYVTVNKQYRRAYARALGCPRHRVATSQHPPPANNPARQATRDTSVAFTHHVKHEPA